MDNFVSDTFKNDINNNVIRIIFPNLNVQHKEILLTYLVNLINVIAQTFNFNMRTNKESYEYQLKQNNYRDIIALMLLLIPYINDDLNQKKKELRSFDELFVGKSFNNTNNDINKNEPRYEFSNVQYGRCLRTEIITERKFNNVYLEHNFYLLLDTIRVVSTRLYVNWIDILPIDMKSYKNLILYNDTQQKFIDNTLNDFNPIIAVKQSVDDVNYMKGLSMHDIYDTIGNEFYYNILKVKWTIYDLILETNEQIPMLIGCSYLFNLTNCTNNVPWDSLDDNDRNIFKSDWKEFLTFVYNNLNYTKGPISLSNQSLQKIAKSLMYTFDSSYDRQELADAIDNGDYIPFNKTDTNSDNNDNDDENIDINEDTNISIETIKNSMYTINPKLMYEYIRTSIEQFKLTWYSRYIIDDKGILPFERYQPLIFDVRKNGEMITVTLKNVYNFSESLISYVDAKNKYSKYPQFWKSLTIDQKNTILNRLNGKIPVMDWFNIGRYISTTYFNDINVKGELRRGYIASYNKLLYEVLKENMVNYIFESMITRGILSQFIPNRKASDEIYVSREDEKRGNKIAAIVEQTGPNKKGQYYDNAYYYLTGTKYSDMKNMTYKYDGNEYNTDYFTYNNRNGWYDAYALNWVSQISFFHKYLNNRIIYVTGATGVGKSTQVPKLLLYALKAIDHKNNGTVICTQPRVAPTTSNSNTISTELGVPLHDNNYYVQYKYKNGSHVRRVDHLMLKIVTDGSLLEEIKNPIFKKSVKRMSQEAKITLNNQYDIVIVDESHEHNKNMDMILTLMKYCVNYNNTIRLVIVSATMDDDEPIYRRFYRDINDNRLCPFNMFIKENTLDRINVDRRLHISPPGQTTRFKINEFYEPNTDPIQLVKKIITTTKTGDILFFQPGEMEINNTIDELNTFLPANVIALPFHSKLSDYQRKIIEGISNNLKNLKIDKDFPFTKLTSENNIGDGRYTRCIIVATNIAEASLTIATLKYVIDTGKQKTAIYDYKRHGSILELGLISESSRLQRKGRVGRTGSGAVYYIYEKGATQFIKKQYDISISNIYLELFDRLSNSTNNTENILFSPDNDPNNIKNNNKINVTLYNDQIGRIITKQYFINNIYYDYYGNSEHYDYNNYYPLATAYKDGYSYETLNDDKGRFYIIHPDEVYLIRNIDSDITGIKDGQEDGLTYSNVSGERHGGRIESKKMMSFWSSLVDNLFISLYKSSTNNKYIVVKTKLGSNLIDIKKELSTISTEDIDLSIVTTLIYGMALNQYENITRILSIFITANGDFINRAIKLNIIKGKQRIDFKGMNSYLGKQTSDINSMKFIADDIHKMLQLLNISISPNDEIYYNELANVKKRLFNDNNKNNIMGKTYVNDLDVNMIKLVEEEKISNSALFDNNEYITMRKKGILNRLILSHIDNKKDHIEDWAKKRSLDKTFVMNYINKYISIKNVLFLIESQKTESFNKVTITDTVKIISPTIMSTATSLDDLDKILLAFVFGFKYNIAKYIAKNTYFSVYTQSSDSIMSLSKIGYIPNTTITETYKLVNYILYLTDNIERNTIQNISPLKIDKFIKYIGYIYSLDFVVRRYNTINTNENYNFEKRYKFINKNNKIIIDPGIDFVGLSGPYKKSLTGAIYDLISYHDFNIWNYIAHVCDPEYVAKRKYNDINYMK